MKGFCQNGQVRIGEVSSKLLPLCQEIIDIQDSLNKVPFAANGTLFM
jgi:hypothetical protein